MFLQLGGFFTVAKGLVGSSRLFKRPTFRERVLKYFKGFPNRRVVNHVISAQGISVGSVIVRGRGTVLPGPNTPLEKRVHILEEKAKNLFNDVGVLGGKLQAQSKDLTRQFKEETAQMKAEQNAIQNQLEKAVFGGIHVEWWGVILFIIGVVFASASPEISGLLGFPLGYE